MLRKFALVIVAVSSLAAASLVPTPASAWYGGGWHGGWGWRGGWAPGWRAGDDLEASIARWQRIPLAAGGHRLFCAHQMGTCRMGEDPSTSVAGPWGDRKSTRLNSSHTATSRMPSSA